MVQPIPMELRIKIMEAVDNGMSCHEAAARFGIAPSTVSRWRVRQRESGDFAPMPQGGDMRSHRFDERSEEILALWNARDDITLAQLRVALAEIGLHASVSGLRSFITRRGMARQKGLAVRPGADV